MFGQTPTVSPACRRFCQRRSTDHQAPRHWRNLMIAKVMPNTAKRMLRKFWHRSAAKRSSTGMYAYVGFHARGHRGDIRCSTSAQPVASPRPTAASFLRGYIKRVVTATKVVPSWANGSATARRRKWAFAENASFALPNAVGARTRWRAGEISQPMQCRLMKAVKRLRGQITWPQIHPGVRCHVQTAEKLSQFHRRLSLQADELTKSCNGAACMFCAS